MAYRVQTFYRKEDIPTALEDVRFFHYVSSFDWYNGISYYEPMMLVVFDDDRPVAAMFALVMRINRFLHGSVFKRCHISQQPAFFDKGLPQIEIFHQLITHLVKEMQRKVFFIRYENLGNAIFGYKGFRENNFYSVKYINVRNSLQRKRKIWDQLSSARKNQVNKAQRKGVTLEEVTSEDLLPEIYALIEKARNRKITNRFPPYRYFENFFHHYINKGKGKILLTRYQNKIIGGIILGFEKDTVYCLYYWAKTKTYKTLFPSVFTIYSAMELATSRGFEYFDFMDAGFINEHAGKTRFLLRFGGKQRATRRWFRFNWGILNFFAKKIYD